MNQKEAYRIYQECLSMNLSEMQELIVRTESEEEKSFYTDIYNYVLRKRQRDCVAGGVF